MYVYILSCVSVKSFGWFTIEIQLVVVNVGWYVLRFSHVIIRMRLKGFNDLKKIYKKTGQQLLSRQSRLDPRCRVCFVVVSLIMDDRNYEIWYPR